jgi:hypothetical protein
VRSEQAEQFSIFEPIGLAELAQTQAFNDSAELFERSLRRAGGEEGAVVERDACPANDGGEDARKHRGGGEVELGAIRGVGGVGRRAAEHHKGMGRGGIAWAEQARYWTGGKKSTSKAKRKITATYPLRLSHRQTTSKERNICRTRQAQPRELKVVHLELPQQRLDLVQVLVRDFRHQEMLVRRQACPCAPWRSRAGRS